MSKPSKKFIKHYLRTGARVCGVKEMWEVENMIRIKDKKSIRSIMGGLTSLTANRRK